MYKYTLGFLHIKQFCNAPEKSKLKKFSMFKKRTQLSTAY